VVPVKLRDLSRCSLRTRPRHGPAIPRPAQGCARHRDKLIKLFDDLQAQHPSATAISVVLDNARYNHSAELKAYICDEGCTGSSPTWPATAPKS
jgi:hypothetical protein